MTQLFSANLGFLWADLPLPEAIRRAHRAGFDAVEFHWPYDTPAAETRAALAETGLPALGLNTRRGRPGENGLAALPGREDEARAAIDEAIAYGAEIGARNVHVMAGFAEGEDAQQTFLANLDHACRAAAPRGMTILIEPLNAGDAPGYFLSRPGHAARLIEALDRPEIRMMYDLYHVEIMEGRAIGLLPEFLPVTGHVQIAAVPDRGPPDHGRLDCAAAFARLRELGWTAPIGAEYRPAGAVEDRLDWMHAARRAAAG